MNPSPLLDIIDTPQDLRRLEKKQLPQVAAELREFLLDSVGKTGGHFASNLGAVELTVALHYVYDTPEDHLVWDVGHQSYPHKILTGRKNQMHTMRQYGGLAGSQNAASRNTTRSAWGILPHPSARHWAWPLRTNSWATTAAASPSSATEP